MFVDDFYKISEKSLENFLDTLQVNDLDMVDFHYWKNEILKKNHDSENTLTKIINKKTFNYMTTKNNLKGKLLKIRNGYFRIIYKLKNKLSTQI
jgi:mRNA-degrading endonuclease RelE of RelBE toxin-antitoxin system